MCYKQRLEFTKLYKLNSSFVKARKSHHPIRNRSKIGKLVACIGIYLHAWEGASFGGHALNLIESKLIVLMYFAYIAFCSIKFAHHGTIMETYEEHACPFRAGLAGLRSDYDNCQ